MEWILELIINSSARRFEQWLMQYIPSSIPDYVDNRDDKPILYIGSPIIVNKEENKFVKMLGSPYLKEDSQGLRFFYIDVSVGPLNTIEEEDETKVSIPLLRIFEKTNEKTIVKINLQLVTISLYIKDMTQEIARLWPETKRDISSLEPINWLDMDDILFDYVIETEPQSFMEWIHFELKEMYPGAFTRKIKNIEYLTHISGDDLPPNTLTSYWEYVIYTHETVFREDINTGKVESYEGFSGAIARIEMRQIVDNRYHVRFLYGEDHPQILEWFSVFKDKLIELYLPEQLKPINQTEGESVKYKTAESQNELEDHKTKEEKLIDQACIEWAGRWNRITGRQNMSEFLDDYHERTGVYLTVDVFKKALKDAGRRGLIRKVNRRWRLPENST